MPSNNDNHLDYEQKAYTPLTILGLLRSGAENQKDPTSKLINLFKESIKDPYLRIGHDFPKKIEQFLKDGANPNAEFFYSNDVTNEISGTRYTLLSAASFLKDNEAVQLLLSAKAHVDDPDILENAFKCSNVRNVRQQLYVSGDTQGIVRTLIKAGAAFSPLSWEYCITFEPQISLDGTEFEESLLDKILSRQKDQPVSDDTFFKKTVSSSSSVNDDSMLKDLNKLQAQISKNYRSRSAKTPNYDKNTTDELAKFIENIAIQSFNYKEGDDHSNIFNNKTLQVASTIQNLIQKNADPDCMPSIANLAPLTLAVIARDIEFARFLIQNGANINLSKEDEGNFLWILLSDEHNKTEEMTQFLISNGLEISQKAWLMLGKTHPDIKARLIKETSRHSSECSDYDENSIDFLRAFNQRQRMKSLETRISTEESKDGGRVHKRSLSI